ncbi:hypothetical protein D3C71_2154780 [compost metagenome]
MEPLRFSDIDSMPAPVVGVNGSMTIWPLAGSVSAPLSENFSSVGVPAALPST